MGLVSLFFKRPQQSQIIRTILGSTTPLTLDATVKESFTSAAEPTQHPVEDGADITDHVILKPNALSISGIVTATPFNNFSYLLQSAGATVASKIGSKLGKFGAGAGAAGGVAGAVAGGAVAKTLASAVFGSPDRDLGAVSAEFQTLRDARLPVDIQTGLQLYESYVLASFTVSRDQKTGNAIHLDLEFKEIILVESQTTLAAIPSVSGGLKQAGKGRQGKGGLNADQTGSGSSLLKKLFGSG